MESCAREPGATREPRVSAIARSGCQHERRRLRLQRSAPTSRRIAGVHDDLDVTIGRTGSGISVRLTFSSRAIDERPERGRRTTLW